MNLKSVLLAFGFGLMTLSLAAGDTEPVNSEDHAAGIVAMDDAYSSEALTKKELRALKKHNRKMLRAEKKQIRQEKRAARVMKFMEKKLAKKKDLGGINDPVDKWFWYWIIGWGGALLLSIVFWTAAGTGAGFYSGTWLIFGLLSTLLWIGGTVCGIIWLVNKLG